MNGLNVNDLVNLTNTGALTGVQTCALPIYPFERSGMVNCLRQR